MQRVISRSTSEEIPLSASQQQYVISTSSLADKHGGSTHSDMVFLNRDMVKSCSRK